MTHHPRPPQTPTRGPLRVAVCDSFIPFATAVASIVANHEALEVAATCDNLVRVTQLIRRDELDVVVVADADASETIATFERLTTGSPSRIRFAAYAHDFCKARRDVLTARGVSAFAELTGHPLELVQAVKTAASSRLAPPRRDDTREHLANLWRQHIFYKDDIDAQIVTLIAAGLTDKAIALHVFLSPQTVRNRISNMLYRTGCNNRAQLATLYMMGHDQIDRRQA